MLLAFTRLEAVSLGQKKANLQHMGHRKAPYILIVGDWSFVYFWRVYLNEFYWHICVHFSYLISVIRLLSYVSLCFLYKYQGKRIFKVRGSLS